MCIWKYDRQFGIYSAPSLEIELSFPRVPRTILLLSSSEYVSNIVFSDVWISKTASNTSAQHASGQWPSIPRPRNCKIYIFLIETLLQEDSRAAVKLSCIDWSAGRGYKRVGDYCLSVYHSNTYCRYKRLFGTPIAFSVRCSLWKIGPIFLDLVQTFCELMIKGDFKL